MAAAKDYASSLHRAVEAKIKGGKKKEDEEDMEWDDVEEPKKKKKKSEVEEELEEADKNFKVRNCFNNTFCGKLSNSFVF